jgi:glutathione-regulated potassium-efflux system ancillary protein KefF
MIAVIHAHPYPRHSRACRALLEAIRPMPDLEVRSLYDLYPDFDIDVAAEQEALARAQLVVWLHPLYWYSAPGMLKHWFDKVLERGWAYGDAGTALRGKNCLWVPVVGGEESTYVDGGANLQPFAQYVDPVEQTARCCGMEWEEPYVVFGSLSISDADLAQRAAGLRARLEAYALAHDWAVPAETEDFAS